MYKGTKLRPFNMFACLAVIAVNALAQIHPLGGLATGEISAMFPVQITPAPYAFSIWGLIYALLLGYAILQLIPGQREQDEVRAIGPWFVVSCFFNISWLFLWQCLFISSSLFVMLGLLLSLAAIYWNTRYKGWSSNRWIRFLVQMPFSLYFGWITAASLANAAVFLYAHQWDGLGLPETFWTVIGLLIAGLLSLLIGCRFHDPFYMLAIVWAMSAIGTANRDYPAIFCMAWVSAGLLLIYALLLLYSLLTRKHKIKRR
ncbi:hypothetical protein SK3146_05049 [Paenibacillus konkukensis]|uniref:Tryptophan-rich sensory protein n=1 Tax=Paenibacillus konkukensis TaxID=2020716 RepID=A0ABY4RVG4_9BACL|nr:hypothetical protein [Paenibacillus konkukensis]UQZ85760.1 hypothetical protein SK3146_05049 [Paenibacillus konkukensis]